MSTKTMILQRGAIVQFDGIPVRIAQDAVVEGNPANFRTNKEDEIIKSINTTVGFEPEARDHHGQK